MSKSLHVLIIDDSPAEVVRFESILHANDFVTTAVNTGEEGIEVAARLKPDIILMDVVMGGMNGFQATRKITSQEATQHIPIIMVTGWGVGIGKEEMDENGVDEVLPKPFDIDFVLDLIKRIMED